MARSLKHRWDLAPKEAVALQRKLASRVVKGRPPWGAEDDLHPELRRIVRTPEG